MEHWDIMVYKNNIYERIDVKDIKESVKDNKIWIELRNVRGENGWLYAPNLDSIAFEL